MKAACIAALMALNTAAPALGQPAAGSGPPAASPAPDTPGEPPAADAAFDVDRYTCQDVLDDLAANRQNRIGIAVVVIYAQLRAAATPGDHRFTLAAIQQVASAAGASCASGARERLLRDVVSAEMPKGQGSTLDPLGTRPQTP